MIQLGKTQSLFVVKKSPNGVYLSSTPSGSNDRKNEVLLPKNQVPEGTKTGDRLDVFIYRDSEDRLIATTSTPALELGEVAMLKVKEVASIGAFLDWGLLKDLLLPFKEQTFRVRAGDRVLVALYIDKSNRLCATMHLYDFLRMDSPYKKDDKVMGTVYDILDNFGAYVAVDNLYSALIPNKELFSSLRPGDSVEARVTQVKDDGKLDLSLREKAFIQLEGDAYDIYKKLLEAGGFLPYHDKSDPELIKAEFHLSKNAFKRAIGHLYKAGKITIADDGIHKTNQPD